MGGIKIDYALISDGIIATSHHVGPQLGSDHRPVIADLVIGTTEPPLQKSD